MNQIRGRLAKGAAWTTLSRVAMTVISLLATFVLARMLTPADFGLVAIATTLLTLISATTEMSLAQALIQHREPSEDHYHTAWTLNLLRGAIIAVLFAAAAWPAAVLYGEPRLLGIMLAFAAASLVAGFANPKIIVFSRDLQFFQDFALQVSQKLAGFIVSVAVAVIYQSYWALVLGVLASQVATVFVSYVLVPYWPRLRLGHWRELFSFSLWLMLGQVLNTFNWRFDYLLIGGFSGRAAFGYYSVGDSLATMPTREATQPFTRVLFPGLVRLIDDRERLQAGFVSAQSLLTSAALPVGFGFALCARPVVLLAMGEKWLPAVPIIQGLSAIFALQTLGALVQPLAMAKAATRPLFMRDLLSFIVRAPLIVAGLLLGGLHGIIVARIVSGLIAIGFNLRLVRDLIGLSVRRQITSSGRSLLSVAVMCVGVIFLQTQLPEESATLELIGQLAAMVALGAILYLGTHYLLWLGAGRCDGPEREIVRFAEKALAARTSGRAVS